MWCFTWIRLLFSTSNQDVYACLIVCHNLCFHTLIQYISRNMHTVTALVCFVVVIHWQIFPYPSGLLHWHCGNLTIAPVPAKQPWWIWINTSCVFIMNDFITTTKQITTKPCTSFLGYTVYHRIEAPSCYKERIGMKFGPECLSELLSLVTWSIIAFWLFGENCDKSIVTALAIPIYINHRYIVKGKNGR